MSAIETVTLGDQKEELEMSQGNAVEGGDPKQIVRRERKVFDIFSKSLLSKPVFMHMAYIGNNLKQNMEKKLKSEYECKCIKEGYIRPDSLQLMNYSSGLICEDGVNIKFEVTFEAQVCYPVEGMLIECTAQTITKAGIKATITKYDPSPVVIFVARDHFYKSNYFSSVQENDEIKVRVIGQRFELNDKYVSIIAELVEPKKKPLLLLEE